MNTLLSHQSSLSGIKARGSFHPPAPGDLINTGIYLIPLAPDSSLWKTLSWVKGQKIPHSTGFTTPADLDIKGTTLVSFKKASTSPPFTKAGSYSFHIEAVKPGCAEFIKKKNAESSDVYYIYFRAAMGDCPKNLKLQK